MAQDKQPSGDYKVPWCETKGAKDGLGMTWPQRGFNLEKEDKCMVLEACP